MTKQQTQLATQQTSLSPMEEASRFISQAIEKGADVNTMERLLAMRKELKAEWAKEQYDRAMAAFQAECPVIVKTKVVKTNSGALAYKYAPIESILAQVKDALKNNGFSYSSNMEILENGTTKVKVTIKVTHAAGHSEITEMTVPLGTKTQIMSETQVVAAASTFAKRYAFCNAFGILTGDEDTDAVPQKEKAESLSEADLKQINGAKTVDALVAVCKKIKAKIKPALQQVLVTEYTRRKDELQAAEDEQVANDAAEALDKEPKMEMTEPK